MMLSNDQMKSVQRLRKDLDNLRMNAEMVNINSLEIDLAKRRIEEAQLLVRHYFEDHIGEPDE
jgi:hypothetical protein